MLKSIKQIKNIHCYYRVIRNNGTKLSSLYFPRVCSVQNEFVHSFPIQSNLNLPPNRSNVRYKSKGKNTKRPQDSDDESSEDEEVIKEGVIDEEGRKVRKFKVRSLRIDQVIKACFGLTRRRIDEGLLSNKFKYNGKPVPKRGLEVTVGDELEMFQDSTDGDVKAKSLAKFVIKKIDPAMDSVTFNIYVSDYNS